MSTKPDDIKMINEDCSTIADNGTINISETEHTMNDDADSTQLVCGSAYKEKEGQEEDKTSNPLSNHISLNESWEELKYQYEQLKSKQRYKTGKRIASLLAIVYCKMIDDLTLDQQDYTN